MGQYKDFLINEMAKPTEDFASRVFFHGTPSMESAVDIFQNGIKVPDLTLRKGKLKPVEGKVYLTEDPMYAAIYAIGGDMIGTTCGDYFKQYGDYGFMFTIKGTELVDIQPDEDSIGDMLYYLMIKKPSNYYDLEGLDWLLRIAEKRLTERQLRKVKEGEYAEFAVAGKKINPVLSDAQKLNLIERGSHIAHTGNIDWDEAYALDRRKTQDINRKDVSSLWKVLTKINSIEDFKGLD